MRSRPTVLLIAVVATFALLLLYPLRHASPTGDDFFYLALGAQLDNPLLLLVQDSTASYFYRPVVMLFWWITSAATREPVVHYAINIGLHAANGLLIAALLRAYGVRM